MSPVGSVSAVMGRIAAIESRLGVRSNPPVAATATMAPAAAGVTSNATSALGLGDAAGTGFVELLGQAEQLITQATYRAGASPFATAPFTSQVAGVPAALDAAGHDGTRFDGTTRSLPAGTPYAGMFEAAAERWGIPAGVLAAVGHVESRFRTDALSPAGAIGVMQFMPATAAEMGVDPTDPASAIDGAARLLRQLRDRFGSLELALGAYNVGPGTIARAGGIVAGSQSEKYVNAVLAASEQFS